MVAESRKISISPQANISYDSSAVLIVLCQSEVAAPLSLTIYFKYINRILFFITNSYNRSARVESMYTVCEDM